MGHARTFGEWIIISRLADIILHNVQGCIVDIGMGLSTIILADYAMAFNRKQYSCDRNPGIIKWIHAPLHKDHIIFSDDSRKFLTKFDDIPALIFLDGDHRYKIVSQEVNFFLGKMEPGAVIFLHDTYPPEDLADESGGKCGDVYKVRQDFEKADYVQTFTWPYESQAQGCGLTMIMKKELNGLPFCRR